MQELSPSIHRIAGAAMLAGVFAACGAHVVDSRELGEDGASDEDSRSMPRPTAVANASGPADPLPPSPDPGEPPAGGQSDPPNSYRTPLPSTVEPPHLMPPIPGPEPDPSQSMPPNTDPPYPPPPYSIGDITYDGTNARTGCRRPPCCLGGSPDTNIELPSKCKFIVYGLSLCGCYHSSQLDVAVQACIAGYWRLGPACSGLDCTSIETCSSAGSYLEEIASHMPRVLPTCDTSERYIMAQIVGEFCPTR